MALQIAYADKFGTDHPEAYAKISKVIIEGDNVSIDVCVYASQKARDEGKLPLWGPQGFNVVQPAAVQPEQPIPIEPEEHGPSLPAQPARPIPILMESAVNADTVTKADTYTWLKTQELFANSIDV